MKKHLLINSNRQFSYLIRCSLTIYITVFGLNQASLSAMQTAEPQAPITGQTAPQTVSGNRIMTITGSRHSRDNVLINDLITVEEVALAPSSVAELLAFSSGLSLHGQPGLFQTLSIRGLARQRVNTYLNGMRLTSERSAGVAASFIDPWLLSGVEVTQGPSATYYGSGAIAGGVHLVTRQDDTLWLQSGFNTDANESALAFGSGGERYQFGVASRTRNNGKTATGEEKYNQFSQHSFYYQQQFQTKKINIDWLLIGSEGRDIGKDNSRFPARITSYPEENHWLSQAVISPNAQQSDASWVAKLYVHQQDLVTLDVRPERSTNQVDTQSLDLGWSLEDQWQWNQLSGIYGIDYFGRRKVSSHETEVDLRDQSQQAYSALADAAENESALFATANREFASWSAHAGVRANYQSQKSAASESISDNFATYFLALNKPLGDYTARLSYGTGFRFASLSERLFSGTTGRGQTIGNPNLRPEESRAFDLGVDYRGEVIDWEVHGFVTHIDDFIERISIEQDTRSYQNTVNGELKGWQYKLKYSATEQLQLLISGDGVLGEDEQQQVLADIPAQRHQVALSFSQENWRAMLSVVHRKNKVTFADGEIPLESVNLVALKLNYTINPHWVLRITVSNLTDAEYFSSMDDLSTLAAGREFSLSISYF